MQMNEILASDYKKRLDSLGVNLKEKEEKMIELEKTFEDLKKTIEDLMYMGPLKTVEITGGGNPTLYPEINELIEFCSDEYGLEVGLITNNIEGRILQENLDKLKWLRISLAYLDKENFYRPIKFKAIDIPKIKGDIGFSYVWNRYSTVDKLDLIAEIAQKHDAKMVRIVPNCLNPQEQFNYRQNIEPLISNINNRLGKDVLFFQGKDYSVHEACYIGKLKPFLNADGYFYHCSAVPLYNRKFTEHWRMGHMSKVKQIWDNDKPFATDNCKEGMCFYKPQNVVLHSLKIEPPHKDFI